MRTIVFFFVLLSACFDPAAGFSQGLAPARRAEVQRGVVEAYAGAKTYYDRGIVRGVQLTARGGAFARGVNMDYNVIQEQTFLFETAYDSKGDFRIITTPLRNPGLDSSRIFFQQGNVHEVRDRSGLSSRSREAFVSELESELSFQGVLANEVPRRFQLGSASHGSLLAFNPYMEEVGFDGRPAYRLVGRVGWNTVSWWVDQETYLILAAEQISMPSPMSMVIVTTLYQPERDTRLSQSIFTSAPATVSHNADGWIVPPLDVNKAVEVSQWANGRRGGSPPAQVAPGSTSDLIVSKEPEPEPAPTPAGSILQQHLSSEGMASIVLIEGETGQGTGFISRINDVSFVITNLHVLADTRNLRIRNARGDVLRIQSIHAARGHDVALIRIDDVKGGLAVAKNAADSRIGDEVVVVGNRLGGGVLTQETGRLLGFGPDRVEVDARFQPGNSGSPIVNIRTGEVIGVATYLQEVSILGGGRASTDEAGKPSRESSTRWFGYRYDSIKEWERIDWAEWQRQGAKVQQFRENSDVILGLMRGDRAVYMGNPSVRAIVERYERQVNQTRMSQDELARENRRLVNDLINFCRSDLQSLDGNFYDYFRTSVYFDTSIPMQQKFRGELIDFLLERERDFRHFRQMLGR